MINNKYNIIKDINILNRNLIISNIIIDINFKRININYIKIGIIINK